MPNKTTTQKNIHYTPEKSRRNKNNNNKTLDNTQGGKDPATHLTRKIKEQ
jgi:hypothetical protein